MKIKNGMNFLKTLEKNKEYLYNKYHFLIYRVIKDLHCQINSEEELEEYVFYGQVGLINAINNYNGEKNTSTFFYKCIKNEIMVDFKRKNTNKRKINYIYKNSLDGETLTDNTLYEMIPDESINIEEEYIKKEQYISLYKSINMLKPIYRDIICSYYGIYTERLTLEQIAKKYNITKQAINVKRQNAIKKLRKIMRKMGDLNVE